MRVTSSLISLARFDDSVLELIFFTSLAWLRLWVVSSRGGREGKSGLQGEQAIPATEFERTS